MWLQTRKGKIYYEISADSHWVVSNSLYLYMKRSTFPHRFCSFASILSQKVTESNWDMQEVRQFTRSVVIQTMQCRHFCTEALFMLWCPVWSVCCRECEIEKTRKKKRFRLKLILLIYLLINQFISELFVVLCWQKYTFLLP